MPARCRPTIAVCALLAACSTPAPAEPADTIFVHGNVLTLDAEGRRAEALAVRGQRIAAVGSDAEVLALKGPDTRVVDLDGRVLVPGFVDTHGAFVRRAGTDADRIAASSADHARCGVTTLREGAMTAEQVRALEDVANELRLAADAVAFPRWDAIDELHDELEDMDCVGSFRIGGIDLGTGAASPDELAARIRRCFENGWHVDLLVRDAAGLDAFLAALRAARAAVPHASPQVVAIVHADDLRDDQLDSMRELGMIAALGVPELAARVAGHGVQLTLHDRASDRLPEPLAIVAAAIEASLPAEQALRAVTIDAARQLRLDDRKGSLEPGKLADLVVLSADPTSAPPGTRIAVVAVHKSGQPLD